MKKLSGLQPSTAHKMLDVALSVARDPLFKQKKRSIRIIDTLRTLEEQKKNVEKGVSKTLDSYHLLGLAVDCGIVTKKGTKALFFHWDDKALYKRYAEIGVDCGFRSLGLIYNWDYGHLEEPQIFQGSDPHCFAYVIVNALQKTKREYRLKTKDECYKIAKSIQREINDKKLPIGVESALQVAKDFKLIDSWGEFEQRDITKEQWYDLANRGCIISQKRRTWGTKNPSERKIIENDRIQRNEGIMGHTVLVSHATPEGLVCINSMKNIPNYLISWENLNQIQAIHVI